MSIQVFTNPERKHLFIWQANQFTVCEANQFQKLTLEDCINNAEFKDFESIGRAVFENPNYSFVRCTIEEGGLTVIGALISESGSNIMLLPMYGNAFEISKIAQAILGEEAREVPKDKYSQEIIQKIRQSQNKKIIPKEDSSKCKQGGNCCMV